MKLPVVERTMADGYSVGLELADNSMLDWAIGVDPEPDQRGPPDEQGAPDELPVVEL